MVYDGLEYVCSEDQFQTMKVLKKDTNIFVVTRKKGIYKLVYGKEKRIGFHWIAVATMVCFLEPLIISMIY